MSPRIINGADELKGLIGEHLGYSPYVSISQEQVNQFADATGDHQWIHIDVERATAGPFGAPIAHGYLTLSLGPALYPQVVAIGGFSMGVNYGTEKVRFPAAVTEGSTLRATGEIISAEESGGGVKVVVRMTLAADGAERPACVVDMISLFYP